MQEALHGSWSNSEDRETALTELRKMQLKPSEAISLIFCKDSGARNIGVESFLESANLNSIESLIDQLSGKPSVIRGYINRIFARLPASLMSEVVDKLLIHKIPAKRKTGWEVALELPKEVIDKYLVRAIREAPEGLRSIALNRLVNNSNINEHQEILIEVAEDHNPQLASIALEAVSRIDSDEVISLMMRVFESSDATSRGIATKYMRSKATENPDHMRKHLLSLLGGGEDATRRACVELLLLTGRPKEVLTEILIFARELVGWLRNRILETLQTFGDEVLHPALELLDHEDDQIRTGALVLAEGFNDQRLIEPLCKLIKDEDWWLQIIACEALGALGDERAVPHLVEALSNPDARWSAIDALANIKSPKALQPLAQLLLEPRVEVRREVMRAFSKFTDKNLIHLLKQVIENDPSAEIRTLAAETHNNMAQRLNLSTEQLGSLAAKDSSQLEEPINKLLAQVREMGGSDLHITPNEPPFMRINGVLSRMENVEPFSEEQAAEAVRHTLTDRQQKMLSEAGEVDYCYSISEVGRYRANAFQQRKGLSAAFRVISNLPPTFESIRIPGHLTELLDYHQGMILVSGPAGSGKSTTLAAIVNLINQTKRSHVLSLEDPIEFVHPVKTALVNQREVNGLHSESFARALRGALREDPDIIVVGQLKDAETMAMALEAAETGHLVIATMNTTSAVQTIDRLVGAFPPEEQPAIRMAVSDSLKYVISQSLVMRKDGSGRVAVFEILKGIPSIQNLIRDNKTYQIPGVMQVSRRFGMQSVDMALMDLYESDIVSAEDAWLRAEKQESFEPFCDPEFLRGVDPKDDESNEGEER